MAFQNPWVQTSATETCKPNIPPHRHAPASKTFLVGLYCCLRTGIYHGLEKGVNTKFLAAYLIHVPGGVSSFR